MAKDAARFTTTAEIYGKARISVMYNSVYYRDIVNISAYGHGSSSDQSFIIKNLYFVSKL